MQLPKLQPPKPSTGFFGTSPHERATTRDKAALERTRFDEEEAARLPGNPSKQKPSRSSPPPRPKRKKRKKKRHRPKPD